MSVISYGQWDKDSLHLPSSFTQFWWSLINALVIMSDPWSLWILIVQKEMWPKMCTQIHYLLTIFVVFSTIKRGKFLEFFCFSSVDLTTFANFFGKKRNTNFSIIRIEKKIMVYINTSVIILVLKVLYTNIYGTWNRLVSKAWQKKSSYDQWACSNQCIELFLKSCLSELVFACCMMHIYLFKYFSFNHPIELTPTIAPLWMNGACIGHFFSFDSCSPAPP